MNYLLFGIVACAVGLAGAGAGYKLAANKFEPKIAELNTTVGRLQGEKSAAEVRGVELARENEGLSIYIKKQNDQYELAQAEAKKREQAAAKALALARLESSKHHTTAQQVLAEVKPAGLGECEAASAAFLAELKSERGQK